MKKVFSMILVAVMALTVFALPDNTFAAKKAPAKIKSSTIKVSVYKGNSLKFSWGAAKLATAYQVQYKVVTNGKTVVKWKTLKKAKKKRYHIYKGTKGNKYTVWIRVRAINGKKFGAWSATRAKAKKITKTIPAFKPKYAAFNPSLAQVSGNRSITVPDYLNTQGCAFDTYTGVDGYNFTLHTDSKEVALVHFRMDANGSINKVGALHYSKSNLGHANDATIYQQGNRKLLFVAISGGTEKSAVDSYGNSIKLAFIDLAEYARQEGMASQTAGFDIQSVDGEMLPINEEDPAINDEEPVVNKDDPAVNEEGPVVNEDDPAVNEDDLATDDENPSVNTMAAAANFTTNVYGVAINTNGVKMSNSLANTAFSGITYVGSKKVGGTNREVFVLKDGRTFYAAYLTITNGSPKLTFFDSARINKPVIKYNGKTYDAITQGVTYHNGYLYLSYSGESNAAILCNMLLGRITYADLFRDTYGDLRNLQICSRRIDYANGSKLVKCVPEAIFFRTLNGADKLCLSVNRGTTATSGSDIDAVLRSNETF